MEQQGRQEQEQQEQKKVRVGVIGCAGIARKVIRGMLLAGTAVEVRAVASRELSKARAFVRDNIGEACESTAIAYGSYEELLQDEEIDAVYMPLPTSLHLQWVLRAAAAGKHILLEKPLSLSVADLRAMLAACEQRGLQLMDGTMWMHHPRTQRMEQELHRIGDIKEIRSVFTFPAQILFPGFLDGNIRVKPELDALGALGDVGWYCVRASLWAVGFELPSSVVALQGAEVNEAGVIISCSARLVWPDGKLASFSCGFKSFMTMEMVVQGTSGSLLCNDFVIPRDAEDETSSAYEVHSDARFLPLDLAWERKMKRVRVQTSPDLPQEALMIREFARLVSDVKNGRAAPEQKWMQMALKTQIVLCAVKESIDAGCKPVSISPDC